MSGGPDGGPPGGGGAGGAGAGGGGGGAAELRSAPGGASGLSSLDVSEVIRRLRILRQPATLFGEGPAERGRRLREAESTLVVEENYAEGGTQVNVLLEIRREEEAAARLRASRAAAQGGGGGGGGGGAPREGPGEGPVAPAEPSTALAEQQQADPHAELAAAFAAAAAKVKAERREAEASSEEAVASYVERLSAEWGQELEARPASVKASPAGVQATHQYKASVKAFGPLLAQLRAGSVAGDVLAALWLIVGAMKGRDYLRAMDLYLKLSIGNAAWPIGVTQVGIHTRSAREKISHVANEKSQAHVMNDEETRKYIHAFKRLITFAQTAYPTDPSKSIDFNGACSAGRGGHGSDLAALRAAEQRGDAPEHLLLPAPRSVLEPRGRGVAVPPKWHQILSRAGVKPRSGASGPTGGGEEPPQAGTGAGAGAGGDGAAEG